MRGLRINCIRCVSPAFGAFQVTLQCLRWHPYFAGIIWRLARRGAGRECNPNNALAIDHDHARAGFLGARIARAMSACVTFAGRRGIALLLWTVKFTPSEPESSV